MAVANAYPPARRGHRRDGGVPVALDGLPELTLGLVMGQAFLEAGGDQVLRGRLWAKGELRRRLFQTWEPARA